MIATVDIGGVAQLVARLNGIQKARGSIPLTSTRKGPLLRQGLFSLSAARSHATIVQLAIVAIIPFRRESDGNLPYRT